MRKLLLICCLVLAGCGEEAGAPAAPAETRLVIEVRPTGKDPAKRTVITRLPPGVTAADFAPVPRETACAEIYGGPATARIDGTLDGEPLHATFDLTNACEMQRWDRVAELLGPRPDAGSGPSPPADAGRP